MRSCSAMNSANNIVLTSHEVKMESDTNGSVCPGAGRVQQEPDADAIKMFVGQIPRSMDEQDLRRMFEEFGPVYQLNVLKDKATSQSRGCCFVTFYTRKAALEAQNALHNIKTLPGMHHPIQVKPADTENRNDRKLFVGMLSKKLSEQDVRLMFSVYGTIEDCTVLRDANGNSKGCAFVTYASRTCALNAIKAMHHSQTMEACTMPLVVKFADTQKDKDQKKPMQTSGVMAAAAIGSPTLSQMAPSSAAVVAAAAAQNNQISQQQQYLAMLAQAVNSGGGSLNAAALQLLLAAAAQPGGLNSATLGGYGSMANGTSLNNLLSLANALTAPVTTNPSSALGSVGISNLYGGAASCLSTKAAKPCADSAPVDAAAACSAANLALKQSAVGAPLMPAGLGSTAGWQAALLGKAGSPVHFGATTGGAGAIQQNFSAYNSAAAGTSSVLDPLAQAYSGIQHYAATFPNAFGQNGVQVPLPNGKQTEGPEGSNLFIYHLPQEFSDSDLAQTFSPFGTVVSAKVFVDKQTNLSKCFGFVSYDNHLSAQAAIQAMNGFQIGTKRLKVQLKRSKLEKGPYHVPQHGASSVGNMT